MPDISTIRVPADFESEFPGASRSASEVAVNLAQAQLVVLAEIELAHPNQRIELPSWIGEEVTFNSRYGNSRLARVPMPRHLVNAA